MQREKKANQARLIVRGDHALFAISMIDDGDEVTYYFADERDAPAPDDPSVTEAALAAIGAWSDLDWDEMEESLDRIRHESEPTPPIDL